MFKKCRFGLWLLMFLLCLTVQTAGAEPTAMGLYVASTGTGFTCTNAAPCSLQYGLSAAGNGDHILMAPGTYTVSSGDEVMLIDKDLIVWGRCLFGGGQTTDCSRNNPETIIDGQFTRRGIKIQGTLADPVNVELHFIKVQNGNATGIDTANCPGGWWGYPALGCGGALYIDDAGTVTISDSHFRESHASWTSTTGDEYHTGGGICVQDTQDFSLSTSQVILNRSGVQGVGFGGGIYAENVSGTFEIDDSLIQANEISTNDWQGFGAGVMTNDVENILISNTAFHGNNNVDQQSISGGALFVRFPDLVQLDHNEFLVNWGSSAVVVATLDGTETHMIYNNRFWDNPVLYNLYLTGEFYASVFNNFFHMSVYNREDRGGATVNLELGGVSSYSSEVDVLHNSFGLGEIGISVGDYMTANIKGNIFANQDFSAISVFGTSGTTANIDHNLFWNNYQNGNVGTHPHYGDPVFSNAAMGDFHIGATSAAIDVSPDFNLPFSSLDYDDQFRPVGLGATPYDLGADEWMLPYFIATIIKN